MLSFTDYLLFKKLLLESPLRISKKGTADRKEELEVINKFKIMDSEAHEIGNIESVSLRRSGHLDLPRISDEKLDNIKIDIMCLPKRADNLTDDDIVTIIDKALDQHGNVFKDNHKVMVVYKNQNDKYDYISVINRTKNKDSHFLVRTCVEEDRTKPSYTPQNNQLKIIVESSKIVIIWVTI